MNLCLILKQTQKTKSILAYPKEFWTLGYLLIFTNLGLSLFKSGDYKTFLHFVIKKKS